METAEQPVYHRVPAKALQLRELGLSDRVIAEHLGVTDKTVANGLLDELDAAGTLTWQGSGGFSVDASVRIEAEDRAGIERLVRCCARPPFALEGLHALDSSTELLLTPPELLDALARFVPPPGSIPTATTLCRRRMPGSGPKPWPSADPSSYLRRQQPKQMSPRPACLPNAPPLRPPQRESDGPSLIARIYDVLPPLCPAWGDALRILAFLTDPPIVSAILLHVESGLPRNAHSARGEGLPHRPAPLSPAHGPPQGDFLTGLLDQTPVFDPVETIPDFEIDRSLPDDFDL